MNAPRHWLAPHRVTPLDATVSVPGSKSLTNRALVLAAIADAPSTLSHPLDSRDTSLMAEALVSLGATIERDNEAWTVTPIPVDNRQGPVTIDCGLAGTVMRFVPPLAALCHTDVTFDGDARARQRPMATTIDTLRRLGVMVDDGGRGSLPFTVQGRGSLDGGMLEIDASASSQFVSALLLAGSRFGQGLDLRHVGAALPSLPHIDMTVTELRRRGVRVDSSTPDRWVVEPGKVAALDDEIEPDLSNAGAFVAAALVTGGRVRVRHWPQATTQAGDAWRDIAVAFGGTATRDGDDLVFAATGPLHGVDLDLHDVGELTPVVAAIAALAEGPSRLTGVAHLRGHETDRLAALVAEIRGLGGEAHELDDGLLITPRPLHGGVVRTYDDHRMAHAAVVLGLRVPDLLVDDIAATAKTYTDFADVWERLVS